MKKYRKYPGIAEYVSMKVNMKFKFFSSISDILINRTWLMFLEILIYYNKK